jgi:5-methylcytosine-specific restriction endonuclease McrA
MPYADPAQRAACKHRHYDRNRDAAKARSKVHYAANIDDRRMKRYEKYWADPESAIQASRSYYQDHKEEILAAQKHPDTLAKRADRQLEREARKREQFVESVDRQIVLERDEGICGICGLPTDRDDFHVDHVIPLSKGGLHCYANVQVAHPFCNIGKGAKL